MWGEEKKGATPPSVLGKGRERAFFRDTDGSHEERGKKKKPTLQI